MGVPDLGVKPLGAEESSRPEVLDLVSSLTSISLHRRADTGIQCDIAKPAAVREKVMVSKGVRTNSDYWSRGSPPNLQGQWVPLKPELAHRGSLLRCKSRVTTDNADACNMVFQENCMARLIHTDSDGDASIVALRPMDVAGLHYPSKRCWLLQSSFESFEVWIPNSACSDEAATLRSRRTSVNAEA